MIYYPLSLLMLCVIREVLIICTPSDISQFRRALGSGSQWGMRLQYAEQPHPNGLAESFLIGADFLDNGPVCMVLGDNIFFGYNLSKILQEADRRHEGATIFGYQVRHPERYGVVELDEHGRPIAIEEKPASPKSHYAVPGLYFYDNNIVDIARSVKPSSRGELEITDINQIYLERGNIFVQILGRGIAWFDTGTHESLLQAASFVEAIEQRQGTMVACLEEIALRNGWITKDELEEHARSFGNSSYAEFLYSLVR